MSSSIPVFSDAEVLMQTSPDASCILEIISLHPCNRMTWGIKPLLCLSLWYPIKVCLLSSPLTLEIHIFHVQQILSVLWSLTLWNLQIFRLFSQLLHWCMYGNETWHKCRCGWREIIYIQQIFVGVIVPWHLGFLHILVTTPIALDEFEQNLTPILTTVVDAHGRRQFILN